MIFWIKVICFLAAAIFIGMIITVGIMKIKNNRRY